MAPSPDESPGQTQRNPPARRGILVTVLAVAMAVVAAIALVIVALRSGDESAESPGAANTIDPANPASSAPPGDAADSGTVATGAAHSHEMGDALPGCDQERMHASMMMFNPVVADELIDGTCPWPYDATIATAGGMEDPAINVAFEPRRYQELFDLFTTIRYGTCNVSRLPDPVVGGFVFGFGIGLRPAGCAEGGATVEVSIREYATRAWRDESANALAATDTSSLAMGRWVIELEGTDTAAVERLDTELVAIGAA